ncbi:MAG: aminodeoxychorismate/anthranilate synthase component II [Cyclobacteriaceae bacterium]|nr:aminodeoxychorismate/anthranilate synthase component II [Cyclobacteriaceae bacterium]
MKILVFDNYDSFTYNLVHIIRELGYGHEMDIFRNDKITLPEVGKYDKILLSPGPGLPADAGIMEPLIRQYAATKSILGICLGHQGIAEVFQAELFNMPVVLHGVTTRTRILKPDDIIFRNLPDSLKVCRYHSWAVKPESINGSLQVTAIDEDGTVMGIRHSEYSVWGLQFHPEAYLTESGKIIMDNWLKQ